MTRPFTFGPCLAPDGGWTFRLWAPAARRVEVIVDGRAHPADALGGGWHAATIASADTRSRYRFRIDGKVEVPDPASNAQSQDVDEPSAIVDHDDYAWRTRDWRGRPWHEAVILELHVGTFTPEGTYRSAIDKLDHVADTGFTAIELMPLADFPGRWNWGYDGVLPYAPDSSYGTPNDLKALVDAAHARGLMVFLDVVYNHFGPEGNYLGLYAPRFFAPESHTPWGASIDYREPNVRAFAVENALHWLDRYRFDGLRLDAVHAIVERGTPSILEEISLRAGELAHAQGRLVHLVLENDENDATLLDPTAQPPRGKYQAQWNDDYHHAWHAALTGETTGYYRDFSGEPLHLIARALASGFAFQGEPSPYRGGIRRGTPSAHIPATSFVTFLQNHDQIGNRARGERLDLLAPAEAIEAALQVLLLAPMPPLMFMGEEWGAREPFPFFCDFHGALGEAVRNGRRDEFSAAYAAQARTGAVPDPLAKSTFRAAKLDWSRATGARLALVKRLLAARKAHVIPHAAALSFRSDRASCEDSVLKADFHLAGGTLSLLANLSARASARPADVSPGRPIWGGEPPDPLPPWSVYWRWSA